MSLERHPYGTVAYAEPLAAAADGSVIDAPEWSSAIIVRPITGGGFDSIGPYPRTPLAPDADLAGGLARLADAGLVSIVLVPDPLTAPPPAVLAARFGLCRPFKTHFLVDRGAGPYAPAKHHRYEIRRAAARCEVRQVALGQTLGDWTRLYGGLAARHAITGAADFTAAYFEMLAAGTDFTSFAAVVAGRIVAMAIWLEHRGVAVNHLGASDEDGYAVGASYALYDAALQHYADAERIDLGGAAGAVDDASDGLARFKRGFANAQATAFLCGAVLDAPRYRALASTAPSTDYFPAYRG